MMSSKLALVGAVALGCLSGSEAFSSGFAGVFSNAVGSKSRISSLPTRSRGRVGVPLGLRADLQMDRTATAASKEAVLAPLRQGNRKWISENKAKDPAFFDKLGTIHTPEVMWIGCADSRVAANEILDQPAGSVFVHRNIANCVLKHDVNLQAGVQYAVDVLEVKHIIVCGHYKCGGVAASLDPYCVASPLQNWLGHIVNVQRLHQKELDGIKDEEMKQRRLVELHAMEQAKNVYELEVVQDRLEDTEELGDEFPSPRVTAVVYDVGTGELKKLNWWGKLMSGTPDFYGHNVVGLK